MTEICIFVAWITQLHLYASKKSCPAQRVGHPRLAVHRQHIFCSGSIFCFVMLVLDWWVLKAALAYAILLDAEDLWQLVVVLFVELRDGNIWHYMTIYFHNLGSYIHMRPLFFYTALRRLCEAKRPFLSVHRFDIVAFYRLFDRQVQACFYLLNHFWSIINLNFGWLLPSQTSSSPRYIRFRPVRNGNFVLHMNFQWKYSKKMHK